MTLLGSVAATRFGSTVKGGFEVGGSAALSLVAADLDAAWLTTLRVRRISAESPYDVGIDPRTGTTYDPTDDWSAETFAGLVVSNQGANWEGTAPYTGDDAMELFAIYIANQGSTFPTGIILLDQSDSTLQTYNAGGQITAAMTFFSGTEILSPRVQISGMPSGANVEITMLWRQIEV